MLLLLPLSLALNASLSLSLVALLPFKIMLIFAGSAM